MSICQSAHRQSVDASSFSQGSPPYGALRTATASLGLNLDKSSMQMGFLKNRRGQVQTFVLLWGIEVRNRRELQRYLLVLWWVSKWPNAGPRPSGASNRGELPSTELHGALWRGGSQVGVGAVAAGGPFCPLTHHRREPKTAFDTKPGEMPCPTWNSHRHCMYLCLLSRYQCTLLLF